ncbi:alpha-amylase family glycosyl hydrolase [Nonlabens ponticola]|uniref:Alpha-amlyase n=1 Tax=Nonlabens ponticola TaxID=2496866 RepID=A0A3S9MWN9_9FLAO|nr:alpha-amylase family glycosyl hydrolase [Nonlabens ponticola]AZQ43533.1 alpha-amlyase [Nonlabens ponticola]
MKKCIWSLFVLAMLVACKEEKPVTEETPEQQKELAATQEDLHADMENAIIYEANIRQYSPEGTFAEFTKDIPQLKELGVEVIWLMPIFPISEKNRKAEGNLLVEDIKDPEERKKYLGSYYAVADYEKINPDLGTDEDLQQLIDTAHENGMYVILDWVANHTGWDNWWINEHPEYYTKNDAGEVIHPAGTDWTDTADLNYENQELRTAMSNAMKYWVSKFNIDGYRCDVANMVPTDFWNKNNAELREMKPVFMLAESNQADLFEEAFDMGYNWGLHHIMNDLAQGETDVNELDEYMMAMDTTYQKDDYFMNFVTNHDENSWNGSVKERMGNASEAMLAMSYAVPGMPLIYSGQEYGMDKRLKFFEKDSIPKQKGKVWESMKKLTELKSNNPALHGGRNAADYQRLETNDDDNIYAFQRSKDGNKIMYVANLSEEPVSVGLMSVSGEFVNVMTDQPVTLKENQKVTLAPFEFLLLQPK